MASFQEPYDSLAAWDFGTSPTDHFTLAATSPAPYLGSSRSTIIEDDVVWAAARFDVDNPNVGATVYWISYAIYIDSWADIFNDDWSGFYLPGFINLNDDPFKGAAGTDGVAWFQPYLQADNSSSGKLFAAFAGTGDGDAITAGTWHTIRYGLCINGASSSEELWLDNAMVFSQGPFNSGFSGGVAGVVVASYGDMGAADVLVFHDTLLYEAGADPGEPTEAGGGSGGPVGDSDPSPVVEDAPYFPEPGGGGAGGATGPDCDIDVFLDGLDVSNVAVSGSVTRRLNRPAQAQITIPMDAAIGGPGSRLKIYFDGTLFFHGMVMDCETDSGEDFGYTVYNASDPMEMWAWRPARDGPDSSDPGDFSNPSMFQEFPTGPQLIEQMLLQSEDDSDPALGEGPLFLTLGTFEAGGVDLSGAPQDWPQTIADVVNLLTSTGEVDVVITPTDPGGGVMGTVDVYNGDYGTDLSGSVTLSYGMGDYSIRRIRWNEDMSNITNKLWYFGGPRIQTTADPEGNQHWCFNVQGDDPGLPGYPASPPYSTVIDCRGADSNSGSRGTYGVRMDIQIFDAASDLCVGKGGIDPGRELYRYLWIAESWARCNPRELIHVTPVRGYPLGLFDIGDLITVEAVSTVRGGFSGAQRIYQYTISWDEDGPCEISELQTSSDVGL